MEHRHHQVSSTADIPFNYYQLTRSMLELHDHLNPRNEAALDQHEQTAMNDFMNGNEGAIHEFWRQDQFLTNCIMQIREDNIYTRCPLDNATYKRIMPALRLATVMMERNMDLWLLILYAAEKMDPARMATWLDQANFNIMDYHQIEFVTVHLPELKRMTVIGYDKTCEPGHFGTTTPIWAAATPHQTRQLKFGIGCSASVWNAFTMPTSEVWDSTPHAEKCRAWVHLAITLVHEFAHALQMYRHRHDLRQMALEANASPKSYQEPIIPRYNQSELGCVFEIKTFGGIMDMQEVENAWINCSKPTIFDYDNMLDIPQILTRDSSGYFTERTDISPDTIVQLMQESTWASNRVLDLYIWQHR